MFHHSIVFHSIPGRYALCPLFPPLWVRTLLSARPAEARPNPSAFSVQPCSPTPEPEVEVKRERQQDSDKRGTARERDEETGGEKEVEES